LWFLTILPLLKDIGRPVEAALFNLATSRMKIVFMGTPSAAVPSLERVVADRHNVVCVYTQPDRPSGRGQRLSISPVKEAAQHLKIPVYQPTKLSPDKEIEYFHAFSADVAVVVAYGKILPKAYLAAFRYGAVNVHFSLLPKYRGAAPVNWAIVNGEEETGVTTMQMDAGLDTGPILLQRSVAIGTDETAPQLMDRLAKLGADLLSETLFKIDSIVSRPQKEEIATMAPLLKRSDGLADWRMSAFDLCRRIRGFQPFPTVFTFFRGRRITFWSATPEKGQIAESEISTIISLDELGISVGCGDNSILKITELQLEGKRRMSAADMINGIKPLVGERFGIK
jgi:methionyl-tRNA formyltransferase